MNKNNFYITTPIYYVNANPHLGHAYTTIFADILARFYRLMNTPVFFLTGTDEHGQKVEVAAKKAGITPKEQVDNISALFRDILSKLNITNNDFIRTTETRHITVVQKILSDLYERGEIYKDEYDGWYCVHCERFFTEKDLKDNTKCPECERVVDKIKESNYFFRMSKYQDWLIDYINNNPKFIQPDYRRNETLGFLQKKLNDLCISRIKTRLTWGIELPFDNNYVTYVWFDALVNYISAIGYLTNDALFNQWWPASCHLIGKDILTPHTVYWPIMLKAMGLEMPKMIFAHGWWMAGEAKMSKSIGNVINPIDIANKYSLDALRYYLMTEMIPGQDASFSEDVFIRRFNADLANDLGNLLNRVKKLINNYYNNSIPNVSDNILELAEEKELWDCTQEAFQGMMNSVKDMRLDVGLNMIITAIRKANRYLEIRQPWRLAKDGKLDEAGNVLYLVAEVLRVISGLLYPVMPDKMKELRVSLGLEEEIQPDFVKLKTFGGLRQGTILKDTGVLFPRIV